MYSEHAARQWFVWPYSDADFRDRGGCVGFGVADGSAGGMVVGVCCAGIGLSVGQHCGSGKKAQKHCEKSALSGCGGFRPVPIVGLADGQTRLGA